MNAITPLPNDKQTLLDGPGGFEVYNRELVRKVFPRIIREVYDEVYADSRQRKPDIRDIIAFYFTLQSYIDGNYLRADGTINDRFGACFISYETLTSMLRIERNRIKQLADILEANGIIRTATRWESTRKFKWYFPSYCPRITDDGYVVDEDGTKIVPDMNVYRPRRKRKGVA
ncbi:hypothetical protein DFP94_101470 [Fontibacillus phaseoli]|uniref:Replication initiator protein A n=1 Tax=Fontibacillus phaseoli TaxID=1416533 RepID=A0A369BNB1_9BACL|nr:hypothetical protein [Fontibacillus phaseoli]RCX22881.1 hypothetical protein DFP94_101470 [Fontibacillus phaseoli]